MSLKISKIVSQYKFWFYFRKLFFQGILPITLAFITLIDIAQNTNGTKRYRHIYIYTSIILFIYTSIKVILDWFFSVMADDVILKKDLTNTITNTIPHYTINLSTLLTTETLYVNNVPSIIVMRRIFKLRYSHRLSFAIINRFCWWMGIDSPLFISSAVIRRVSNYHLPINHRNEQEILHLTLHQLYHYRPYYYQIIQNQESPNDYLGNNASPLLPQLTNTDKSIMMIQRDLFGIASEEVDT